MAQTAVPTQDIKHLVDLTLSSFEQFRIKRRDLRFSTIQAIGGGGFGSVHRTNLGTWALLGGSTVTVVVKMLYTRNKSFLSIAVALAREVAVWAPLSHPNLVPFIGFHLDIGREEAWLVSSYAENGTILDYIRDCDPDLRERAEMATDTIKGLDYLHTRQPPVCHGDIKPVNVLVNSLGRAILCDFGLAQTIGDPTGLTTTDFRNGATLRYQSPEIFKGQPRSLKGDIWAWGCLALELLSGLIPYQYAKNDLHVFNLLFDGNPPAHLNDVELLPPIRELLAGCWAIDSELRPTSKHCLDLLTAPDKEAFRQKSLWASPAVVDTLKRDLDDALGCLDCIRLRRSLITLSSEDATEWGGVRPAKMGQGILSPGTDVAVKILRVAGVRASCVRMLNAVIRELQVWWTLDHPSILPLVGFYLSDSLEEAWFISELMPQGNVMMYLGRTNPGPMSRLALIRDVANGLVYLHGLEPPLCHGDVKPSNILVNQSGRALLCDFGLARSMEGLQTGLTTSTFDQCKSIAYNSPESFLGGSQRSPEGDMWAFGCVAHEIFSEKSPYSEISQAELVECVRRGDDPNDIQHVSIPVHLQHVIRGCWLAVPQQRFTANFCFSTLDSYLRLGIDPSQITNLESGVDAEWTTGKAMLADSQGRYHDVMVRRVRIPNDKEYSFLDILLRLSKWEGIGYPYVQKLFGICVAQPPSYFWLILERSVSEDVIRYAADKRLRDRLWLVENLTYGLHHLHTQDPPFCHGHLNPGYILLDIGYGAMVSHPDLFGSWCKDTETRENVVYASPEALDGGELTLAGDVWSWGCIVQEVLGGQPPYSGVTDLAIVKSMIRQGVPPAEIDGLDIPVELKDVIRASWEREPGARPPISVCWNQVLECCA